MSNDVKPLSAGELERLERQVSLPSVAPIVARLLATVRAYEADSKRLDYLDEYGGFSVPADDTHVGMSMTLWGKAEGVRTVREAIDAAMSTPGAAQ